MSSRTFWRHWKAGGNFRWRWIYERTDNGGCAEQVCDLAQKEAEGKLGYHAGVARQFEEVKEGHLIPVTITWTATRAYWLWVRNAFERRVSRDTSCPKQEAAHVRHIGWPLLRSHPATGKVYFCRSVVIRGSSVCTMSQAWRKDCVGARIASPQGLWLSKDCVGTRIAVADAECGLISISTAEPKNQVYYSQSRCR